MECAGDISQICGPANWLQISFDDPDFNTTSRVKNMKHTRKFSHDAHAHGIATNPLINSMASPAWYSIYQAHVFFYTAELLREMDARRIIRGIVVFPSSN